MQKKRASGGGIAEDFVTLPRKRDTPRAVPTFGPTALTGRPIATRPSPLACYLKTAVRLIFPRL